MKNPQNLKRSAWTGFLLVLAIFIAPAPKMSAQSSADFVEGQLFLKVKNEVALELPQFENEEKRDQVQGFPELMEIFEDYGVTRNYKPFKTKAPEIQKIYQLHFEESDLADALVSSLQELGYLEYAEKIPVYSMTYQPNDLDFTLWGLNKIQPTQAWDITQGTKDVVVAIVDDAVLTTHEDLAPQIWTNPGEIPNNGIDDDGNGFVDDVHGYDLAMDDNNADPPNGGFTHGTHVAGIAAAATDNGKGIASIAFNVSILPCKTKDDTTSGPELQYTYHGVDYAIATGADVVNMSFGGQGFSFTFQTLVNTGHNLGVTFVAAAGNDDQNVQSFPCSYDNVISVASTSFDDSKSGFSNYHITVDVSAPGSLIRSCLASSNSSYGNQSGTSMASPMAAGLCALILSADTSLTPDEIETCLESGCDNIDIMNSQYIGQLGAGRINAHNSLLCLSQTSRDNDARMNWSGFVVDNLYPNPAQEKVHFSGSFAKAGDLRLQVLDLQGRVLAEPFAGQVPADFWGTDWEIPADFATGMYLVKWEWEGFVQVKRLVVE